MFAKSILVVYDKYVFVHLRDNKGVNVINFTGDMAIFINYKILFRQGYFYLNNFPYAPAISRREDFIAVLQNNAINNVRVIFALGADASSRLFVPMFFVSL
jgi:hypothetical protein